MGVAGWIAREKYARLSQISALLNVDSVNEVTEFYQQPTTTPYIRLTPAEVRKFLALRVDLPSDQIRSVKV